MQSVIGIDIGTSGTKAVALTTEGNVIASARSSYAAVVPAPGYHELEPVIVLRAASDVLEKIFRDASSVSEVAGVALSAAMHGCMAVDKAGRPLTNFITWADLRSNEEAMALKSQPLGQEIYEFTGTPIHAMSPLCKIAWLRKNRPEIFASTARFIGIKEYIWHAFFNKYQVDHSLASATGMFDIRLLQWFQPAIAFAGIREEMLSSPVDPLSIVTGLSAELRKKSGCRPDLPFVIGASDGCLANLGSRAIGPGQAALTIGTSGALRMASANAKPDPQQRIFHYILSRDLYISGGGMNNGGAVLQWYINQFLQSPECKAEDYQRILSGVEEISSDGLIFLPYLFGERAPIWNEDAKGVFFGIRPSHGQKHFLRSLLEGISYGLCQIGHSIEETLGPIEKIYASGGFIRSKTWVQIVSDVFDREVGACILGLKALGIIGEYSELPDNNREEEIFFPDRKRHLIHQRNMDKFKSLYTALKEEF
jgi:gluconokinase